VDSGSEDGERENELKLRDQAPEAFLY
jgi:hypothetical protein